MDSDSGDYCLFHISNCLSRLYLKTSSYPEGRTDRLTTIPTLPHTRQRLPSRVRVNITVFIVVNIDGSAVTMVSITTTNRKEKQAADTSLKANREEFKIHLKRLLPTSVPDVTHVCKGGSNSGLFVPSSD